MKNTMIRSILKIIISIFVIINISSESMAQTDNIPKKPFPKPAGPYNIGTEEFYWIDNSREEMHTKNADDKRRLMVQVWYPADQKPDKKGYPYITNPDEFGDNEVVKKILHIRTNSIPNALVSEKLKKYPVLVFSHGMGMSRFSNTSQVEHLVSHGYIVFGIDHTFDNRSLKYRDGYLVKQDVELSYVKVKSDPQKTALNMYNFYDNIVLKQIWQKDAEFVINKIGSLNNSPDSRYYKRINLEKMGMFGYSMGGITTMQICCDNPGIIAGVSYDGGKAGDAWGKGISQPFMFIEPEDIRKSREENEAEGRPHELYLARMKIMDNRNKTYFSTTKNINYILTFSGTTHGHFNDLGLIMPQDNKLLDTKLCHKILNEYTLAFFDKYLKGIDSGLLNKFPGKYKDAKFSKK